MAGYLARHLAFGKSPVNSGYHFLLNFTPSDLSVAYFEDDCFTSREKYCCASHHALPYRFVRFVSSKWKVSLPASCIFVYTLLNFVSPWINRSIYCFISDSPLYDTSVILCIDKWLEAYLKTSLPMSNWGPTALDRYHWLAIAHLLENDPTGTYLEAPLLVKGSTCIHWYSTGYKPLFNQSIWHFSVFGLSIPYKLSTPGTLNCLLALHWCSFNY